MKYISLALLIVLMSWTWCLATGERALNLEEHKRVEDGVEQDIREFIGRRFPEVKEVYCSQLYTEVVNPGTDLIAHFRCQAVSSLEAEDAAEQVFDGFLRLKSNDRFATWAQTGGEIHAREVNFLNGFKITPEVMPAKGEAE